MILIKDQNNLDPMSSVQKGTFKQGRNFVTDSGGDDSRILSRAAQKLFYLAIFCQVSARSCNIWIGQQERIKSESKSGGDKT